MNNPSFLSLIQNVALLLSLVLLFDLLIGKRHILNTWKWQLPVGFVLGFIGMILMMTPWVLVPGIIFDTRSVLLGISGLFFGTIPTLIAIVITSAYRIYLGGAAAAMGVSVIITTGISGIIWRKILQKPLESIKWWELYVFGLAIHLVMLLCTFVLPLPTAFQILSNMSLPVMVIYPIGTMLLGLTMINRLRRENLADEQKLTEARMKSMVNILQHPVESVQEFLDFALNEAVKLTGSEIGYFFQYDEDSQQFTLKTITRSALDTCSLSDFLGSQEPNDSGLLGEVIHQRHAVIVNDTQKPNLKSPQANTCVQKFISIPINYDNRIVAVVGVANRKTNYDDSDVLQLTLLMDGVWKASERKLAEEALRQSEDRYKTIVDNLPNGLIHILDRDFRYIFNAGEGMIKSGLTNEMLVGKTIFEVLGTETGEMVASFYRRVLEGESVHIDGKYNGNDYLINAAPLRNEQGEVSQILALSSIITEQKQAEEQLRTAQEELKRLLEESDLSRRSLLSVVEDQKLAEEKLQRLNLELESRVRDRTAQLETANRELEAFAYSVSHDLRAPLRALDGFSSMLISDYKQQLDEQAQHYLARIQEATLRMNQLIEDLLNLSRVTRRELVRTEANLSQIAWQITSELSGQDPDRKVKFSIAPEMVVNADPNLLGIALNNLLGNAYKFTSHCECAHIEFGRMLQNSETVYFVRDDGAGFNMEYADKLFTPFQRLHTAREFPGTGIGLVTVQRIITRHGGRIWPEAEQGKGATFYFTLGEN